MVGGASRRHSASRQINQGRPDVHSLHKGSAAMGRRRWRRIKSSQCRRQADNEWDAGRGLAWRILCPFRTLAQLPAMIAEKNDDGVVGKRRSSERRLHPAQFVIHIRNGGVVVLTDLFCELNRKRSEGKGNIVLGDDGLYVIPLAHIRPRLVSHVGQERGEGGRGGRANAVQRVQVQILGGELERNMWLRVGLRYIWEKSEGHKEAIGGVHDHRDAFPCLTHTPPPQSQLITDLTHAHTYTHTHTHTQS